MAKSKDPVCGMMVDEQKTPGGSVMYKGKRYFFCSPECRRDFEKDPEKYAK